MPPTRRSISGSTPVKKTRSANSNQDRTGKQSVNSATQRSPRRKKPSTTSQDKESALQTPDKDGGCEDKDTISSSTPGSLPDGSSRRSSRQRTVSKRLQDMEVYFGKKKEQIKREPEEIPPECTPTKKKRQDRGEKSTTATAALQTPASVNTEDTESTSPEVTAPPTSLTSDTDNTQPVTSATQTSTDTETEEAKEGTDSSVPTEPEQPDRADISTSSKTTEGSQESVTVKVTLDSCVETIKDPDQGPESSKDTEHVRDEAVVLECEVAVMQPSEEGQSEVAVLECTAVVTPPPQEGQSETVSNTESQGNEQPEETNESVNDPVPSSSCADDSVTDTDMVLDTEKNGGSTEKDGEVQPGLVTVIDNSTENDTDQTGNQETASEFTELAGTEDSDMRPEDDQCTSNKDTEPVHETHKEQGNTVEDTSEKTGAETVNVVPVEVQQPADNTPQFVMLDDGRQLLLSNADALATAADAVASLSQMKEVSFILNNDNGGSAPAGSDGQVQKIKFVTINAPVLHGTIDNSKVHVPILTQSDVQDCQLDMRMGPDGQVAAGPATVLSADGYYRCSMCAYKTDKKANWYKHRYTHMPQRRYPCDKCDHQATTSSNLKRHQLIHSDIKIFSCDLCNAEFRQKIHLMRHVQYKHQTKEVKCGHCDYVCANFAPDLLAHIKRRHQSQSDSSHKCETCGFTAANSRDLKQHLKFHKRGPELKLYCELCSFVTDCASRLQRHNLVHNKLRPFWCSLCSYKASQKEHVMRHLRTKHKMTISSVYENVEDMEGVPVTTIVPADIAPAGTHTAPTIVLEAVNVAQSLSQEEVDNARECTIHEGDRGTEPMTVSQNSVLETSIEVSQPPGLTQLKEQEDAGPSPQHQLQEAADDVQDSQEEPSEAPSSIDSGDGNEDGKEEPSDDRVSSARARLAAACSTRLIYAPTQKTVKKKHYPPADFSSREKMFSCIHCTMKFSKLINLYKHMNVQHKNLQTSKGDGMHTCVWCEYQTNKWKNLLVHMRKHNYREEYGTVTTRYACVVCTYTSQHRKALYAHMMKKHKVQIYIKPDGSASCVIDDTIPGTMSGTDGNTVVVERPKVESTPKTLEDQDVGMMTHHDQEQAGTTLVTSASAGMAESQTTQTVMIELEPGMPATAVEILAPQHAGSGQEDVDHEAADAIEGLQALAEQVMAAQHQQDLEEGEVQLDSSLEVKTKLEEGEVSGEVPEQDDQTQIHIQDCSGQVMEGQNIQLTPEQLMQLTSGDFIEINGEMYKVEVAEETPTDTEESYT